MPPLRHIHSVDGQTTVTYQMRDSDRPMRFSAEEIHTWFRAIQAPENRPLDVCLIMADWLEEWPRTDARGGVIRKMVEARPEQQQIVSLVEWLRLLFFVDCSCDSRGCDACKGTGMKLVPDDLLVEFNINIGGRVVTLRPPEGDADG